MPIRENSEYFVPNIVEIYDNPINEIAKQNWLINREEIKYNNEIIILIYNEYIKKTNYSRKNIMILEYTQYLENYLWLNYNETINFKEYILSIIIIINEKFRSRLNVWKCFEENNQYFNDFFIKLYNLVLYQNITYYEHALCAEFILNCVNSLEIDIVRLQLQEIISISSWSCLLSNRLKYELEKKKIFAKLYSKYNDKFKKLNKQQQEISLIKSTFMSKYIKLFLNVIKNTNIDNDQIKFIHYFMQLLIELESVLCTRRFFHVLFDDHHVLVLCRISNIYQLDKIFIDLWDILKFYSKLQIDPINGVEFNEIQILEYHYNELSRLQKIAYKYFKEELREFYLTPVYTIDSRESLIKHFSKLSLQTLKEFVHKCNIINIENDDSEEMLDKNIILEILISKYEKGTSLIENINKINLYPDEKLLWGKSKLPDEEWNGEKCLALPRLNLQFLTLNEYLWKNYILFSLESTYAIRNDIEDAIIRLKPWMNELGETQFIGWARMALPLKDFAIMDVGSINVSTQNPQYVYADLTISTQMRDTFKQEWLDLRKFDPIFLLSIEYGHIGTILDQINNDDDHATFPTKYGILAVRGAEIVGMLNDEGNIIDEIHDNYKIKNNVCHYRVALDPNQYQCDINNSNGGKNVYHSINVIVRRKPKENNFKAVLETIRSLINVQHLVPNWLGDIFLGYGDPYSAHYSKINDLCEYIDFYDTFINTNHLIDVYGENNILFENTPVWNLWKLKFENNKIHALGYELEIGPLDERKEIKKNKIQFTKNQIESIYSGLQKGLTLIVGPPGSGKTDVAVQIISTLFNTYPNEKTLIVTHSNQALNQIFEKIVNLEVDEKKLIRLGHGEEELKTIKDFSRKGRVNYILERRIKLLNRVLELQNSLKIEGLNEHTCETANNFFIYQILPKINQYCASIKNYTTNNNKDENCVNNINDNNGNSKDDNYIMNIFPFTVFMRTVVDDEKEIFVNNYEKDYELSLIYIDYIKDIFKELNEYRSFELLRSVKDRSNYLVTKICKIVAMTCVHAALKRQDMVDLQFQYDNIIIEESGQILEIETFIPLLLQNAINGYNRLKRIILIGDHNQLPPIVRSIAFQKYCNMEQSLYSRLIRLGVPYIQLDKQGRCRESICELFNWRYKNLKTLDIILNNPVYKLSNPGILYEYQFINVEDFENKGETEPTRYFIQNLGEAEYAVSLYIYMRLLGYPSNKISILTMYNGQKHLIRDIIKNKCSSNPLIGEPLHISTVDRYQGEQNDYIILSLVRTKTIGYMRDIRRFIVAVSRARLGLYVLGRINIFSTCYELKPIFDKLLSRSLNFTIINNESYTIPFSHTRSTSDDICNIPSSSVKSFESVIDFSQYVHNLYLSIAGKQQLEEEKIKYQHEIFIKNQQEQYQKYLDQMSLIAEEQSKKFEGLIINEIQSSDGGEFIEEDAHQNTTTSTNNIIN